MRRLGRLPEVGTQRFRWGASSSRGVKALTLRAMAGPWGDGAPCRRSVGMFIPWVVDRDLCTDGHTHTHRVVFLFFFSSLGCGTLGQYLPRPPEPGDRSVVGQGVDKVDVPVSKPVEAE